MLAFAPPGARRRRSAHIRVGGRDGPGLDRHAGQPIRAHRVARRLAVAVAAGRLVPLRGHGPLRRHLPLRRIATIVSSNRMYIVTPRTVGLTRSPPGVATAAKIAIPRMIIAARRSEPRGGHDPDPRQGVQHDRELHQEPEGEEQRRHEVEVGRRGEMGDDLVVREPQQEAASRTAGSRRRSRRRGRRRTGPAGSTAGAPCFCASSGPGATNAQSWYSSTGIARMIPTTIAIRIVMENASPGPRTGAAGRSPAAALTRTFWIGSASRNPIDRAHRDRERCTGPAGSGARVRWSTRVITAAAVRRRSAGCGRRRRRSPGRRRRRRCDGGVVALRWPGPRPRTASASAISGQPRRDRQAGPARRRRRSARRRSVPDGGCGRRDSSGSGVGAGAADGAARAARAPRPASERRRRGAAVTGAAATGSRGLRCGSRGRAAAIGAAGAARCGGGSGDVSTATGSGDVRRGLAELA